MKMIAGLCALSLLMVGCKEDGEDYAGVSQHAILKPIVAIVPVIDSTKQDLPWHLGDELTAAVHQHLGEGGSLYLVNEQKVADQIRKFHQGDNPFGDDLSWVKRAFSQDEFVVFLELVEHEEVPVQSSRATTIADCAAELTMSIRVRVLDMRGKEPRIVLQELIHDSHSIPRQFTKANFYQVPWGKESFNISPMGVAHEQLTKQVADRLEEYILLAMSRRAAPAKR
jgi:hypothetical protein